MRLPSIIAATIFGTIVFAAPSYACTETPNGNPTQICAAKSTVVPTKKHKIAAVRRAANHRPFRHQPVRSNSGHGGIRSIVVAEAVRQGVPVSLALGVARTESGFNPRAYNRSSGASGVMQLLPSTARGFCGLGRGSLMNPHANIRCGVSYLKAAYRRAGSHHGAATLYNAGIGAKVRASGYSRKVLRLASRE